MEIIYFLLLMVILMLSILIISIRQLDKNIIDLHVNIDNKLNTIQETIIDPNYKYKKVYESKRYEQNI